MDSSLEEEVLTSNPQAHYKPLHVLGLRIPLNDDNINAFSGAMAGLVAGVAVCPLDVVKTKLQAQGGFRSLMQSSLKQVPPNKPNLGAGAGPNPNVVVASYKGIWGTLRKIYQEESVRGLYRGLTPIVIGYIPTWTIYFLLYEKTKRHLAGLEEEHQHEIFRKYPSLIHIISAVCAGSVSSTLTNPIWVVKTRLMSQGAQSSWDQYTGTWDAVKNMYKKEGIAVFYSGLGPALLGLSHVAVQFPLYERLKQIFGATDPAGSNASLPIKILASSALSKLVASALTYPHEVLRTRSQISVVNSKDPSGNKYRGILKTIRTIYVEEGVRGFYAGLGTTLLRAIPSSVVTICTYELFSRYLRRTV